MRKINVIKENLKILTCIQELAKIGEKTIQEIDKNLTNTEKILKK